MNVLDLIIVGAGPAGMASSIYASRYKLTNIVIGKELGGEISLAHKIENYPGFQTISGLELAEKMRMQVESLGAKVVLKEVGKVIHNDQGLFTVTINGEEMYSATSLIMATGSERRKLNVPGEKEYMGKGVSYCHTCDAPFFRNKTVTVVGGSDSAVSGAVHTAEYASKVFLVYRGEKLRAEPMWCEEWQKLEKSGKGQALYHTNVLEIEGDGIRVNKIKIDKAGNRQNLLETDGVFIEIGSVPGTSLVTPLGVKLDDSGHVLVNDRMETNIPGLYCAGDMVSKSRDFKQATWAIAQGARAAASVYKFIKKEAAPQIRGI